MKFAVVILTVVAAASAQFPFPRYTPGQYNPGQYNPGQYNPAQYFTRKPYTAPATYRPFVTSTPAPFAPTTFAPIAPTYAPVVPVVYKSDASTAGILRDEKDIRPDGSYNYAYETANGIAAQETGVPKPVGPNEVAEEVTGSYSYTSPEGVLVVISYVANENGFQPSGDSIPQPPPVPEAILRSLEYIAKNAPKAI